MSCSPYDLRDYLFEELTPAQSGDVRAHLKACTPCAAELDALRSTQAALLTLRDEDIPQRIGFVSDKVFEPSPVRRFLSGFWTSAARIGFVSSAMLSAALLVFAFRPAQPVHNSAQSGPTQAEIARQIETAVAQQVKAQVDSRLTVAVNQAVSVTEARAQKRTTELLAAVQQKYDAERRLAHAEYQANLEYQRSKYNVALVTASYAGGGQ
jgi:anti-sigma factor RsiW